MSNMKAFLKQNRKKAATVKYVASEAFTDENGKPMEWEIKSLSPREVDKIRELHSGIDENGRVKFDNVSFNRMLAAKCTVFPNLNDKELQDSYGVMGADELVQEMFEKDGEYQKYVQKVLEVGGYTKSDKKLVDEAKNS